MTIHGPAREDTLRRELLAVQHLPAAPEIIERVGDITTRDDSSAAALAAIITRDPSLAARVLGLANSPFVSPGRAITSITTAVLVLGFPQVRELVLGVALLDALDPHKTLSRSRRRAIWLHSAGVALGAQALSQRGGHENGLGLTAGLLHDIGQVVLGVHFGETYWELVDEAQARQHDLAQRERHELGADHGVVGSWLLERWSLPPALIPPLVHHHDPRHRQGGAGLASAVALADLLVTAGETNRPNPALLDELGMHGCGWMTVDGWREIASEIARAQNELAHLLDGGAAADGGR